MKTYSIRFAFFNPFFKTKNIVITSDSLSNALQSIRDNYNLIKILSAKELKK